MKPLDVDDLRFMFHEYMSNTSTRKHIHVNTNHNAFWKSKSVQYHDPYL